MKIFGYKIANYLIIILLILFVLSFINLYRFVKFLIFPTRNEKSKEELLTYVETEQKLQYISWFSYLFFFLIILAIVSKQTRNLKFKLVGIIIILFLIYLPVFPILNIINLLLILFLKNPPFLPNINKEFPLNIALQNNHKKIKKEFENFKGEIECYRKTSPILNGVDSIDTVNNFCWRTLYLKKTGKLIKDEHTANFPIIMNLLEDDQIHNAVFSILDPHVEIKPHFGYFKGYLRYHLGVIIPEENGKKPYIICGGQKYEWKEGKGVVFDDMFLHYVQNTTSKKRVVLFLDIKRKNTSHFTDLLVRIGSFIIEKSFILDLFVKNQHIQDTLKKNKVNKLC